MRVLIVEDETAAYDNLVSILASIDPMIEIVGNTEGVGQTIRWLESHPKPDLIFMDIHLSDGSAFAIFTQTEVEVPIIFTTAYDEYAIEAFKVKHRIPCYGYNLVIDRAGKFDPEKAKQLPIPVRMWGILQSGEPVEHEGVLYTPDLVMGGERRGLKVRLQGRGKVKHQSYPAGREIVKGSECLLILEH